ncbi:terpene cyclase/mutase family protein [Thalassospira australica]|uniref:terpene cyclase/mutase family protein n=1 Tax=Thalassospira australica TaxID=1528106 RepID=UPI00068E448E|nr:terpene cyclase/mutase family protein [Thalassospira australica]
MDRAGLIDIRDRVLARMARDGFAGADPFDGLESRLFQASGLGRLGLARLCWVQAIKRGPDVLRKAARIPHMVNPKTLALLSGAGTGVVLADVRDDLLALQNPDGGWGYPFAWQARAFYAKHHQSNAIVTSFGVDGLMETGVLADHPALIRAAEFIAGPLWRDSYFAYFDHTDVEIHNASLWAGFALLRIIGPNAKSEQAVARVLRAQRSDGGWTYGTRAHHGFIDGFHTGYILDLLGRFRASGMVGLDDALACGWGFYRSHCFDHNGLPRSFADKDGYRDAHAVAQAMASLCRFGDMDGAVKVARWAAENLFDPERDVFFAGIGRLGPDRRNYMRWTQAWMVWGLSIVIETMAMDQRPNSPVLAPDTPLVFAHPDPERNVKEAALRALSDTDFRALYVVTRKAAAEMKARGEMEALYDLTRGLKTLQRIAGERGLILAPRPTVDGEQT